MTEKKIKIPIYGGHLHFIMVTNTKEMLELHRINPKKYLSCGVTEEICTGFSGLSFQEAPNTLKTPRKGATWYVIFNKSTIKDFDQCVQILAHEAYHIVSYISSYCGLHYSAAEDEGQAYLHDWCVEQGFKFIKQFYN
jgi:hypothetical protein